jgi:hypothetical protein
MNLVYDNDFEKEEQDDFQCLTGFNEEYINLSERQISIGKNLDLIWIIHNRLKTG